MKQKLRHVSPLRYPGGKAPMAPWLADIFAQQLSALPLEVWVEPFAGGAGAGLTMLNSDAVDELWIIDANPAIAAFWTAVKDDGESLARLIEKTTPDMPLFEWARQVAAEPERADVFDLGYAAFILNRCSRSGIIAPNVGPIGGKNQSGDWTVNSRFNAAELAERIRNISGMASRLRVTHGDGIAHVEDLVGSGIEDEVMLFVDPPYIREGNRLYTNGLDEAGHQRLADALNGAPDALWMLTYDDEAAVPERFYPDRRVLAYEIRNTVARQRIAEEFAVFSDALDVGRHPLPLARKQSHWVRELAA